MTFISELRTLVDALAALDELHVDAHELPAAVDALSEDEVARVLGGASELRRCAEKAFTIAAGVAARRSKREHGHKGMAATRGHRTPVALVQSITGGSAADAKRAVRVGESLLDAAGLDESPELGDEPSAPPVVPWHEPLRRALLSGRLTSEQHDAILRGLADPPVAEGEVEASDVVRDVWAIAAEQLVAEAATMPVEELRRRARTVRDVLDPEGAEARFAAQYERRVFRPYTDAEGCLNAHVRFDPEMGPWVLASMDGAMRPRRGGPRFVDAEEIDRGDRLRDDPRTNEQLMYDLFIDIFRAGALANAADVFGARQPGVRMVVVKDAVVPHDPFARMLATGHVEDRGDALPGSVLDRNICMNGIQTVTVDECGNPLDVGREQRLFTPKQRIALAVRDGGCVWPECTFPASYCEAHHRDHWDEGGRTDIDDGVLLCRFHHLLLHNQGWRIMRDGKGPFVLIPPPGQGDPIVLKSKAPWSWAWDPSPPPDRPGWRDVGGPPVPALARTG